MALLEHAPLFSVLPPEDMRDLATKFYSGRYRRSEAIFREGEPAERLFLVSSGRVKLHVNSSRGDELLVAVVGRGEIFGKLAVIDRGPRAMSARALGNVLIVALFFVAITYFSKGRVERFMTATPTRLASFTASSLIIAGTFFVVYWGIKSGSRFGWYGWPTLPWQN